MSTSVTEYLTEAATIIGEVSAVASGVATIYKYVATIYSATQTAYTAARADDESVLNAILAAAQAMATQLGLVWTELKAQVTSLVNYLAVIKEQFESMFSETATA